MHDDYGSLFVCVSVCVVTKLQQAFTCMMITVVCLCVCRSVCYKATTSIHMHMYCDKQTRIKDYSDCFYMLSIHKYGKNQHNYSSNLSRL